MSMKLFEIAGQNPERRFSPYCWRAKLSLAHKGLSYELETLQFTDKTKISDSGSNTVPVLQDGDKMIGDSFAIAQYLDEAYPDAPQLFNSASDVTLTRFVENWTNTQIMPALFRMIILDVFNGLHESDQAYFRETREARFGMKLEDLFKYDDEQKDVLFKTLTPMRMTLSQSAYLGGETPSFADYIVAGSFLLARSTSDKEFLKADDDVMQNWYNNMLNLFDGFGKNVEPK